MYYHASQTAHIKVLETRISNHGIPLVYFSAKRENVLIYLSNAIEKFCREAGFEYSGIWQKWGPYGFEKDGRLQLQEYYPNALTDTYRGVSGYIYCAEEISRAGIELEIPNAAASDKPVPVIGCEFIPDAYEAILEAERSGLLTILRYENLPEKMQDWLDRIIPLEYSEAENHPEYRYFLREKFRDRVEGICCSH